MFGFLTPVRSEATDPLTDVASVESFWRKLPKNDPVAGQKAVCEALAAPVARSDLKRGDIVFFGFRGTFTHVGIYAGNDQFVHATHRGSPVMVTPLDGDYFHDRYMMAVRLSPR